jgi:hypothetical protein
MIFRDLGSGTQYGSRTVSAAVNGTNGTTVSIPLNADAIAALNAARGGTISLGGALTSIVGRSTQMVFAYTTGNQGSVQLALAEEPDADWYSITLPSGQTTLRLQTSTPGDGPGQFTNLLNPKVEVFNAAGTSLLGTGTPLPDGRNETVTVPNLTAGGTYLVRVTGENQSIGEYLLGTDFVASPPPPPGPGPGPGPGPTANVLVNGVTTPSAWYTVSRLTSLQVNLLSTAATVDPGAFTLTGAGLALTNGGGGILVSGLGTNSLTLSFTGVEFGSLADGTWTLTIDHTKIRNGSGVSGTGSTVVGDIRRLFGDGDANGQVDQADYRMFNNARRTYNPQFDYDADGVISLIDSDQFYARFGTRL